MRRAPMLLCAVLVVLLELGATGCVSLPDGGAVRSRNISDAGDGDTLVDYTPAGPQRGAGPVPLVDSFLTAMTATPLDTSVAREFLSTRAAVAWSPGAGTVSYGSQQLVRGSGGRVTLRLRDVVELDDRGAWLGDPTDGTGHDYRLRLVREDGQWRISNPPDRLLVPRAHFETQYEQHLLYFFDQASRVLVPEPVFVSRGRQAATLLVAGLLRGPEPYLDGVEQTYVPGGTSLDGPGVQVSEDGTARVPMTPAVLSASTRERGLLFAQLAWTLRQVQGVRRFRVTVAGSPLRLGGAQEEFAVEDWSEYDPSVVWASASGFGLREGRVVALEGSGEAPVSGPLGGLSLGLRSVGVDLLAQRTAGVRADGHEVVEAKRDGEPGRAPLRADVSTVYTGDDVLRPAYDLYGQLWLVDRTASGARLSVVRSGSARPVPAPGLTGTRMNGFLLSRDGTRLVGEVRRRGRDELMVARVRRDAKGRVLGLVRARPLAIAGAPGRIKDMAWRSPAGLVVLVRPSVGSSRLLLVEVDGSSDARRTVEADLFEGRAVLIVSSPAGRVPLFLGTAGGRYLSLSSSGHWVPSRFRPGLSGLTYVG